MNSALQQTCYRCSGLGFISPFGAPEKIVCFLCKGQKASPRQVEVNSLPAVSERKATRILIEEKPTIIHVKVKTPPKPKQPRPPRLKRPPPTEEELHRRYVASRLRAMQLRAEKKGMDFDMDADAYERLRGLPCEYCGGPHESVDRKDNNVGYTQANCVSACKRCNTVKSFYLTYDEMFKVVDALGWRIITYQTTNMI